MPDPTIDERELCAAAKAPNGKERKETAEGKYDRYPHRTLRFIR
jgi:hypothetical protein